MDVIFPIIMYYRMEAQRRTKIARERYLSSLILTTLQIWREIFYVLVFSTTLEESKNNKEHFLTMQMQQNILDLHHITTKKGYEVE